MTLAQSVRAKGELGMASRVGSIVARFGTTPTRMRRYLSVYVSITEEFGTRPTLPITASVLARHPDLVRAYRDRGVEFAIHGLIHNDHSQLGLDEQLRSISAAVAIFDAAAVPYCGFRAPYLRYNEATQAAARALGFRYHSSQAVEFAVLANLNHNGQAGRSYRRALTYYRAADAASCVARPRSIGSLVDIPVTVPDDEIMVDRLRLPDEGQKVAWLAVLDSTYRRGDLFTIQLHPERILQCAAALRAVLAEANARQPGIWLATLGDIASWWQSRQQTQLSVESLGGGSFRVQLRGDPRATLVVRGLGRVPADRWFGQDMTCGARDFTIASIRKPIVGVSRRTPGAVVLFLREEGYPVELADSGERLGAYVDVSGDNWDEISLLDRIDHAPGPLVRLWRWPEQARSALTVTGDIDSITLQDFGLRLWESSRAKSAASRSQPQQSPG
jgi:peptidoglycan/xylan/chitin deacetylase (PgdA/CDA1 family)